MERPASFAIAIAFMLLQFFCRNFQSTARRLRQSLLQLNTGRDVMTAGMMLTLRVGLALGREFHVLSIIEHFQTF